MAWYKAWSSTCERLDVIRSYLKRNNCDKRLHWNRTLSKEGASISFFWMHNKSYSIRTWFPEDSYVTNGKKCMARFSKRVTYPYIIGNFGDQMSDISAPILTCCDGQSDAANQEYLVSFQRKARDIVSFMNKGIYIFWVSWCLQNETVNEESYGGGNQRTSRNASKSSDDDGKEMSWNRDVLTYFLGKALAMFHFAERPEA